MTENWLYVSQKLGRQKHWCSPLAKMLGGRILRLLPPSRVLRPCQRVHTWWMEVKKLLEFLTAYWLTLTENLPLLAASCGGGWVLRARIGMTINLPGHPLCQWHSILFSHKWHTFYSGCCLLICIIPSNWTWCLC